MEQANEFIQALHDKFADKYPLYTLQYKFWEIGNQLRINKDIIKNKYPKELEDRLIDVITTNVFELLEEASYIIQKEDIDFHIELEQAARQHYENARKQVSGRTPWDFLDINDPYDMGMRHHAFESVIDEVRRKRRI